MRRIAAVTPTEPVIFSARQEISRDLKFVENVLQEVTGLNSISLSRSTKKIPTGARVFFGSNCEWIDLNKVLSDGVGCANGLKFVIKPKRGSERPELTGCKFSVLFR